MKRRSSPIARRSVFGRLPGLAIVALVIASAAPATAEAQSSSAKTPATTRSAKLPPLSRESLESLRGTHYGYPSIPEAQLAALPQSIPPGGTGLLTRSQRDGGARDEIGLAPAFAAMYVITMDPRALQSLKAHVHALYAFPYHLRKKDGALAEPWLNPRAGTGDFAPDRTASPGIAIDLQHQPLPAGVYALAMVLAGDRAEFFVAFEEMKARVAFNFFATPPSARNGAVGIVNPQASVLGLRGAGWSIAALAETIQVAELAITAGWLAADDPWYRWMKSALEQTAIFLVGVYKTGTIDTSRWQGQDYYGFPPGKMTNRLGLFLGRKDNPDGDTPVGGMTHYRAFMQAFMCQGVLFANGLKLDLSDEGKAALASAAEFAARWVIGINGPRGAFDYRRSPMYDVVGGVVIDQAGYVKWPDDFAALYRVNYPGEDLGPDDHLFRDHNATTIMGSIGSGFVADELPALSMAVDQGFPAGEAFARVFATRQMKQNDCAVQFAILPRGVMFGQALPVDRLPRAPSYR